MIETKVEPLKTYAVTIEFIVQAMMRTTYGILSRNISCRKRVSFTQDMAMISRRTMIETRVEKARKCGRRKPGGIYIVSDGELGDCGRLPIPLTSCPTCGGGFHAARGWTWVDGRAILGLATPECKCLKEQSTLVPFAQGLR